MTEPATLPNGMRLGQNVQTFTASGGDGFPWVAGTVIGYYDHPSVLIRLSDGTQRSVSSQLRWEPLVRPAHPPAEVEAIRQLVTLYEERGIDLSLAAPDTLADFADDLLDALAAVRGGR